MASKPIFADLNCSFAAALAVAGDAWSLLIVREAILGVSSFEEFHRNLRIPRTTLSDRLRRLVEADLLEAVDRGTRGTRFEYQLTEQGRDLLPAIIALQQWGDRWQKGAGSEPILLGNRNTGSDLSVVQVVDQTGAAVSARDISVRPGPGADKTIKARFS